MTTEQQATFDRIRAFVLANEPESPVRESVSRTIGNYQFAVEGRKRGSGYVTVYEDTHCGLIACESPLHFVFDLCEVESGLRAIETAEAVETARRMVASGEASGKLETELDTYLRHSQMIANAAAEGRVVGRNVKSPMESAAKYIRDAIAELRRDDLHERESQRAIERWLDVRCSGVGDTLYCLTTECEAF